ncbi:hypothetical protein [Solitalea lacus]|uniref:hypothetical protein n=1 Tax=Solitalea lacus TaxID=2911172 RepID=UPI001EDBC3A8|nr:hypothetical protein [Solitalea lacus]UKJ07178.1 hypothetical protein L2B55_16825 [Solitalea lacus]
MNYFYTLLLCLFTTLQCFAQADSSKTTLTLAAIYNSNVSYYGQTTSEKMPMALTNATVKFPFGLYVSSSAYNLFTTGSGMVFNVDVGYDFKLAEKLASTISISRAFIPENAPLLQASNPNTASAALTYTHWLTTGLSVDYAFGQEQDWFITLNNSKPIELGHLIDESDFLTLEPAIEFIGGTQRFTQYYATRKNPLKGKPTIPGNGGIVETSVISSKFGLLTTNFKLPLAYSRSSYLAEIAYQFSVLGKTTELPAGATRSFFNLSFYYQF